jgi:hypothetical protein
MQDPDAYSSVPDDFDGRDMVDVEPALDRMPCPPDELVWLSALRVGVPAHRVPASMEWALAHGTLLKASVATDTFGVQWCVRCWPDREAPCPSG